MSLETLLNELWQASLARLGGEASLEASARKFGAFRRARAVGCATDLLRLILAYCLGGMGLRLTSAWAASVGLADLSNVALLKRLRKCGAWMEHLVGMLLSERRHSPQRVGGASGFSMEQLFRKLGKTPRKTMACGGFIAPSTCLANASASSS